MFELRYILQSSTPCSFYSLCTRITRNTSRPPRLSPQPLGLGSQQSGRRPFIFLLDFWCISYIIILCLSRLEQRPRPEVRLGSAHIRPRPEVRSAPRQPGTSRRRSTTCRTRGRQGASRTSMGSSRRTQSYRPASPDSSRRCSSGRR